MLNDVTDYCYGLNGMVRGGNYVLKTDVLKLLKDKDAEIAALTKQVNAYKSLTKSQDIRAAEQERCALVAESMQNAELCTPVNVAEAIRAAQ